MTTLILMYVYFDINGDIKMISPDPVLENNGVYEVATFPISDVEGFLTSKKNSYDFFVKVIKRPTGPEYKILRKQALEINYTRTLDQFLTEITTLPKGGDATILIENYIEDRYIRFSLSPIIRIMRYEGTDDEQDTALGFINYPKMFFFFTKKHDPYYHIHSMEVVPRALFDEGEIIVSYKEDLSASSLYTKKIVDKYSYITKKKI